MSHPAPCPQTMAQDGQGRCALFSSPVWPCFFWDNVMCYALRCAGAGCPCRASALGCPRSRPIRREHGLIRDAPAALPSPPTLTLPRCPLFSLPRSEIPSGCHSPLPPLEKWRYVLCARRTLYRKNRAPRNVPASTAGPPLPPASPVSHPPVRASLAASGEAPYGKTQTPANCLPAAVQRVLVRAALCGERQNKGPRLLSLCRMREIPLMGGALGALLLSGCAVALLCCFPSPLSLSLPLSLPMPSYTHTERGGRVRAG